MAARWASAGGAWEPGDEYGTDFHPESTNPPVEEDSPSADAPQPGRAAGAMGLELYSSEEKQDARTEFGVLDTDRDNKLDEKELCAALRQIAGIEPAMIPAIAKAIFEEADLDKDGKIDVEEFFRLMEGKKWMKGRLSERERSRFGLGWCDCTWCCECFTCSRGGGLWGCLTRWICCKRSKG
jgi:hypothetical protein